MHRIVPCTCLLILWLAADSPARGQDSKKALAALQGTWKLRSVEREGKTEETARLAPWVIRENKVLYGGTELAVLTVEPATSPASIDLTFLKPKRSLEGIFTVEKDTLKICVNQESEGVKDRPLDFTTEGKANLRLLVFERTEPGPATEGAAGFVGLQLRADPDRMEVHVAELIPGGPAQTAGLKKHDVLVKVGGGEATDLRTVVETVRQVRPGDQLTFRVRRDGKEQDIPVRVGVIPFYVLDQ